MAQDFVALQWVSGEIEQTADQLGRELLGFADNVSDQTRLRHGLTLAHQVHATLRVLAVPGAERLARELEESLQAMLHGRIAASEPNLQLLLAASMQLPAYLKRVALERREAPLEVHGLVNELRAMRAEAPLPAPPVEDSIDTAELALGTGPAAAHADEDEVQLLRLARQKFQAELLGVLRREALPEHLRNLGKVFALLAQRLRPGGHRLFWQACAALTDALDQGGVAADDTATGVLRDLDAELRAGIALERRFYQRAPDAALYRRVLVLLARSRPVSSLLAEIQQRHRLVPDVPGSSVAAPVDDLGATGAAVAVLGEELSAVLARLEATEGDAFGIARVLREVEPELKRIAQLLAGLGYREEYEILQPQIGRIASGLVGGSELDDRLTEISAALLDVDQRLAARALGAGGDAGQAEARRHPLQRALAAVCREVQGGLEQIKQTVADYASSALDVSLLAAAPARLHSLQGALRLAQLDAASGVLAECRDYLASVTAGRRPAPGADAVEALADALSSVEYFLERLAIDQVPAGLILDRAREALSLLAEPGPVAAPESSAEAQHAAAAGPEPGERDAEDVAPAATVAPSVEAPGLPELTAQREPLDQEILEIFVEEANEVLAAIAAQLPSWRAEPSGPALTELRRAFHTLKGSGRMVGAEQLGELSWAMEQLLNRLMDRGIDLTPGVVAVLERAQQLLPALLSAFATQGVEDRRAVQEVQEAARALLRGEEPQLVPAATEPPVAVEPGGAPALPVGTASPAEVLATEPLPEREPLDPEIVGIFVEEANEVVEAIAAQLPSWRMEPSGPALTELRRAFHTLKGSGRMVGAELLGDLAWSMEHLLSRVVEHTLEPVPAVMDIVDRAQRLLPALVQAFATQGLEDRAAVAQVLAAAGALARGEPVPVALDAAGAAAEAETPVPPAIEVTPEEVLAPVEPAEEWLPEAEALPELVEEFAPGLLEPAAESPAAPALETGAAEPEAAEEVQLQQRLQAIFGEELVEHRQQLRGYLAGAERGAIVPALLRTLHTLRGSSRAAGNAMLVPVLEPLEELVHGLRDTAGRLEAPELELLDALGELLDAVLAGGAPEALATIAGELRARVLERAAVLGAQAPALGAPGEERMARFLQESLERLFHATSLLEAWRAGPDTAGARRSLLAELQSIQQRAEQLHLDGVLQLSQPLLAALKPALAPDEELFDLARQGLDAFLDVMDRLAAGQWPETPAAIIERLQAAGAAQLVPAEAPGTEPPVELAPAPDLLRARIVRDLQQAEEELLGIFIEEADELMAAIDEAIESWRHDRAGRAPFDDLQRHLHTLKGGARMAGLKYLGELSHNFETFLINQSVQFGGFDDAFFTRVAAYHEQLLRTMDVVRERPQAVPEAVVAEAVEAPVEAPVAELPAAAEALPVPEAPAVAVVPAERLTPRPVPPPVAAKPRDEVVRVSAQLLEDLVNLAGETSISRGRVEEQVSELGQLFEDMQSAIDRLQSQVRRLDIATEAQVLFRRERAEGSASEGFDPLEMDRYSQLQQLSRSLVESASDLLDIKRTLAEKTRDLETVLIQQSRINSQLQEGLMRSRMVPFSSILPRLKRVVRQVAAELHKQAELELGNISGELDRGILERVVAPLEHMLRNAVDHGIEAPELRRERGKQETGSIHIEVSREGGDVLIAVSDDGAGINLEAVRAKAIERGLLDQDARPGDRELAQFILHPGFSTAATVTQISGRGVGMDVVSSEIRQMGGSLEIHNRPGQGTRFVVRLPFTVSVSRALLVRAGPEIYALPLNTVAGVVRMRVDELGQYAGPDASPFQYAGQSYAVRYLGALLYPDEQLDLSAEHDTVPVVLVRGGGQALAVEVDRLIGAREIAVKSLGPQFGAVPGLSGATVLGDGSVVLILDIPAMLRADSARGATSCERVARDPQEPPAERPPLIMVVDDSVTVRKVTTRFLEREGMQVITAKDGADAMLKLQEQVPDVMLLDIEMPHMDGFEVVSKVRLSEQLRHVPIIMITSRTGEKHRERALSLGANGYLGKPYQESVLLEHIRALLARERDSA